MGLRRILPPLRKRRRFAHLVHEELAARRESRDLAALRLQAARLETELAEKADLLAERAADVAFLRQQLARVTKALA